MTYPEAIKYLESFINYEKIPCYPYKESLRLERIRDFLEILGNPQVGLNSLHVSGTKGKGSTCAFLAYILKEAGFKVGLYTSPHLSDFRERIRVLTYQLPIPSQPPADSFTGMITADALVGLVERIKPSVEYYNKKSKYGPLSFFEVYTSLALLYFKEQKTDFVVLETGLGGRLDATNVVNPLTCGITPISLEHTDKLGNSLVEIAREKAGIIKNNQISVISAAQSQEAAEVIRQRCRAYAARLYEIGKDIFFEEVVCSQEESLFNLHTIFSEYPHLKIRLLGKHQLTNASLAVGMIEALRSYELFVEAEAIRKGLENTAWPGRLEIVGRLPWVVLDGAQNIASALVLKEAMKLFPPYKKLLLVLGISQDKDIQGICGVLSNLADRLILTRADNPRAAEPEYIRRQFSALGFNKEVSLTNSVQEAIKLTRIKAEKDDLVLVTGSLFVVGEARTLLVRESPKETERRCSRDL